MSARVAAIHFPESDHFLHRFWKMDGPDKPGHDGLCVYFESGTGVSFVTDCQKAPEAPP
jgi:hypothetical protein